MRQDEPLSAEIERIERSNWGRYFLEASPETYMDALAIVLELRKVSIEKRYVELEEGVSERSGVWVVIPELEDQAAMMNEFWLAASPDREELEAVCEEMEWTVLRPAMH